MIAAIQRLRGTFWRLNRKSFPLSKTSKSIEHIQELHAQGRFEDAKAFLEKEILSTSKEWYWHNALALTHLGMGCEEQALADLNQAEKKLNESLSDVYLNRSAVYKSLLDYQAACEHASHAILLDPRSILARLALIGIHAAHGQIDRAKSAFQDMDRECDDDPPWHKIPHVWQYLDNDTDFAVIRDDPDFHHWFALKPSELSSNCTAMPK